MQQGKKQRQCTASYTLAHNSIQCILYGLQMYIYHLLSSSRCFAKKIPLRQATRCFTQSQECLCITTFIFDSLSFYPRNKNAILTDLPYFISILIFLVSLHAFSGQRQRFCIFCSPVHTKVRKHVQISLPRPQNWKSVTEKKLGAR